MNRFLWRPLDWLSVQRRFSDGGWMKVQPLLQSLLAVKSAYLEGE